MINPGQVLNSPIRRSMLNSGVTRDLGNIAISSATPMSSRAAELQPGHRVAAMPPMTTTITVVIRPIPIELISAEENTSP